MFLWSEIRLCSPLKKEVILFTSVLCFQIREPFSVMSLLKSPMGLMLGFMMLVMFVMPKLVDGMGKSFPNTLVNSFYSSYHY